MCGSRMINLVGAERRAFVLKLSRKARKLLVQGLAQDAGWMQNAKKSLVSGRQHQRLDGSALRVESSGANDCMHGSTARCPHARSLGLACSCEEKKSRVGLQQFKQT